MIRRYILSAVLTAILILCGSVSNAENITLNIGNKVPSLELPSLSGASFDQANYVNKPYIITFFTTWSQSCVNNLKFLNTLTMGKNRIPVVAVSFDNKASKVSSFFEKNGLTLTGLIDKKKTYLDKFHILIIPMTFLVDRQGELRNIYVDFDDSVKNLILADVEEILKEKN